jgi:protein disulfide-isomerase
MTDMRFRCALPAVALVLALADCGGGSKPFPGGDDPTFTSPAPTAAPTASPSATASSTASAFDPSRDATADITAALGAAQADSKPVLLDFGASWCPDCVALAHTFTAPTVQPLVAGFHVVEIDVGKFDRNTDLAAKYGIDYQHSGIPALVVLSPQGQVRTTTEDGSFADASRMTPAQVATFLRRWQH